MGRIDIDFAETDSETKRRQSMRTQSAARQYPHRVRPGRRPEKSSAWLKSVNSRSEHNARDQER